MDRNNILEHVYLESSHAHFCDNMATRILDRVRRPRKPITKADSVGPPDDYFGMSELMAQNEGASDNTTDTHATTKRMVWELGPASGERHQVVPKSYEFYREWPIFFAPKTCKFVEIWCESVSRADTICSVAGCADLS